MKSNRQWAMRPLRRGETRAFRRATRALGQPFAVAHASYLPNLASGDADLWERSVRCIARERQRCRLLDLRGLVVHPGSHRGDGVGAGLDRVARALERITRTPGAPPILLENTAGGGAHLGARLEEIGWLTRRFDRAQVGVCLDTCHLHAAGYRLDTADGVATATRVIGRTVGWRRVACVHLNDSRDPAGSRRDRHAGIGAGSIGMAGFSAILAHRRFRGLPGILETPKGADGRLDRVNLELLRRMPRDATPPTDRAR